MPITGALLDTIADAFADRGAASGLKHAIRKDIGTLTDTGGTDTFDVSAYDWWQLTLTSNPTLALKNVEVNQQFTIQLNQDATGSRTVTWWSGIRWAGGTPPTLTTTPNKWDVFSFKCTSAGVYIGFVAGQNI